MSQSHFDPRDIAGLKFDGGRFDQKGFPLDAGNVLKKYRDLILKAAKLLWKTENPGRRLPNGFERDFQLGLVDSIDGSTIPVIEAPLAGSEGPNLLAERAAEMVNNAFWEVVSRIDMSSVKDAFLLDEEILAFNKALSDDEVVEFRRSTSREFRVDAVMRERIRGTLEMKVVRLPGTIIGKLHTIDTDGGFALKTPGGVTVRGTAQDSNRFDELKKLTTQTDDSGWIWVEGDIKLLRGASPRLSIEVARDFGSFGIVRSATVRRLSQLSIDRLLRFGNSIPIELLEMARDISELSIQAVSEAGSPGLYLGADADREIDGGVRLEWVTEMAHLSVDVNDDLIIGFSYVNLDNSEPKFGEDISGISTLKKYLGEI